MPNAPTSPTVVEKLRTESPKKYRQRITNLFKLFCSKISGVEVDDSDDMDDFLEEIRDTFELLDESLNQDELKHLVGRMRDECDDILNNNPQVLGLIEEFEKESLPEAEDDSPAAELSEKELDKIRTKKAKKYYAELRSYGYTLGRIAEETNYSFHFVTNRYSCPSHTNDNFIAALESTYPFLIGKGEKPSPREINFPLDDFYISFKGAENMHTQHLSECYFWGIKGSEFIQLVGDYDSKAFKAFIANLNKVLLKGEDSIDDIAMKIGYVKTAMKKILSGETGFTLTFIYRLLTYYSGGLDHQALFEGIPKVKDQLPTKEAKKV